MEPGSGDISVPQSDFIIKTISKFHTITLTYDSHSAKITLLNRAQDPGRPYQVVLGCLGVKIIVAMLRCIWGPDSSKCWIRDDNDYQYITPPGRTQTTFPAPTHECRGSVQVGVSIDTGGNNTTCFLSNSSLYVILHI